MISSMTIPPHRNRVLPVHAAGQVATICLVPALLAPQKTTASTSVATMAPLDFFANTR